MIDAIDTFEVVHDLIPSSPITTTVNACTGVPTIQPLREIDIESILDKKLSQIEKRMLELNEIAPTATKFQNFKTRPRSRDNPFFRKDHSKHREFQSKSPDTRNSSKSPGYPGFTGMSTSKPDFQNKYIDRIDKEKERRRDISRDILRKYQQDKRDQSRDKYRKMDLDETVKLNDTKVIRDTPAPFKPFNQEISTPNKDYPSSKDYSNPRRDMPKAYGGFKRYPSHERKPFSRDNSQNRFRSPSPFNRNGRNFTPERSNNHNPYRNQYSRNNTPNRFSTNYNQRQYDQSHNQGQFSRGNTPNRSQNYSAQPFSRDNTPNRGNSYYNSKSPNQQTSNYVPYTNNYQNRDRSQSGNRNNYNNYNNYNKQGNYNRPNSYDKSKNYYNTPNYHYSTNQNYQQPYNQRQQQYRQNYQQKTVTQKGHFTNVQPDDNGEIKTLVVNHKHYYICKDPECGKIHLEGSVCDLIEPHTKN